MQPTPSRLPRSGGAYQVIGGALVVLTWGLGRRITDVSRDGGAAAEGLRGRAVLVVVAGTALAGIFALTLPSG